MFRYRLLFIVIFFIGCQGLGFEKQIYKDYYLTGTDNKNMIDVSLKLKSGDFIGRIEGVKEYAIVNDTLLFAKAVGHTNKIGYFILNMDKDFDVAKIEDVVIGPLDSLSFANNWGRRYKVKFISVFE